jgi:beta-galactosidase
MRLFTITVLFLMLCQCDLSGQVARHTFALGERDFLLDGKPFQIIAGEMHFARIPRPYWRHRLQMAKAMGLNTIATYVFWNFHEPLPGKFGFSTENHDIASFIRMAKEEGLWVIVRPGPYACAEWEFGGFPWWLLKEKDLLVRSKDPRFLKACERYIKALGDEIAPLQVTKGGPILMVQVENEYGSYSDDKEFMGKTRDMIVSAGIDVPLFTADGPYQCKAGYLPGVLPAINGEENAKSLRDTVKKYNDGKGPYFIPEFYPGWLDSWGEKHNIVPVQSFLGKYDSLLTEGVSVSLYMFHGGTTFGFMNGANYNKEHPILPQPSTYDYDAPLDEAGRPTPKFMAMREVIAKHLSPSVRMPDVPPANKIIAVPAFKLSEVTNLYALLGYSPLHGGSESGIRLHSVSDNGEESSEGSAENRRTQRLCIGLRQQDSRGGARSASRPGFRRGDNQHCELDAGHFRGESRKDQLWEADNGQSQRDHGLRLVGW